MKSQINCLPQGHRLGILVFGVALILSLGWFGASTHVHALSKIMHKSQLEYHQHISAASDLLDNTDRIVYQQQLAAIDDVTQFLQDSITKQNNLQLISIVKHAPIDLSADDFGKNLPKEGSDKLVLDDLYAYDATIDLLGDYFNFLDYLKMVTVESKYNFYWVKIDYKVVDYPTSEMKLVVRTINHNSI